MKPLQFTALLSFLILSSCTNGPEQKSTRNNGPGAKLYNNYCQSCHGADGTAGIGGAANLQTSRLDTTLISKTIGNGRNAMPAFKSALSSTDIHDLKTYVLSLRK